jgi:hypothetical protein
VFAFLIDVHLTGGKPLWQELVGPVLLAATAIIAAWIAAKTANKRQAAQLAHDRELQKAQFAYDREQRNRQDARDAVDGAVKVTDDAVRVMAEFFAAIVSGDESRHINRATAAALAQGPTTPDGPAQRLTEELEVLRGLNRALFDTSIEMTSQSLRLSLRLGLHHPIVETHDAFRAAFNNRHQAMVPLYNRSITEDDRVAFEAAEQSSSDAHEAFVEACREWLMEAEAESSQAL